uniref:Inositol-1-monophosphatase n=1 Tax=Eucampia antarctica TaxID=49252 RepID=A0A7S2W9W7_9STRA|mmetsp:Transcript_24863/g.23884  ORF Transcript_24863/g.23884 Transcript_24863/m.23884 type:complete len:344 (+) Transcript_24863:31-1062(+)
MLSKNNKFSILSSASSTSLLFFFTFLVVSVNSLTSFDTLKPSVFGIGRNNIALFMSSSSNSKSELPPLEMLNSVLKVAIDASKKAGEIIVGNAGGAEVTKTKANSRDLLTLIDPLCEKIIRETVLASFPDHDFLGEEDVPPGKEASTAALDAKLAKSNDFLWIVDPIDGTSNFVHGMPLCMPSVACAYKGQVVVGVIYDPHRDEMFTAIRGQGAQLNGKPIHVGQQDDIGDAIVAMGSPPAPESLQMSLQAIQHLMPKVRTIRMLGSAALMLAWVANGRLTCYWEYDLSSWDVAAGALLVTEAGGKFTDLEDNPYDLRIRKICASNGKVHGQVLNVLNEAGVI